MSIKEPIKLKDLVEEGAVFDVNLDDLKEHDSDTEDAEYQQNISKFANLQLLGEDLQDEDTYFEGQPFEIISAKMDNLLQDGSIKKRIIREGYGEKPPDLAIVRVHYNAYVEYNPEPFDSTYARNRPHQFSINNGEVIIGLDIAVQSMKLNEKSQYIIQPEFAYGRLGCLNRVPANAEVLFEVELVEVVNVGAATAFQHLPEEAQKKFTNVYDYCLALCAKGKDLFSKNIKAAIREYNTAVGKLEMAQLEVYEDQLKQQELLLRLYTNLLVCYTKIEEPKRGCINFNKIKELVQGTNIKISAKCYFNNAKCLRMLGDLDLAKRRLEVAYKLEPKNPDILNEMIVLENEKNNEKKREIEMSKALVKN
ncbi:inactive peptidyl-prolyl cis-trans isomerase shutdown [Anoplophora glabripennis]|nr:inactive peptidyl-prolyl cis-trans isomerase shutdown [Anoplophora glabripennis]